MTDARNEKQKSAAGKKKGFFGKIMDRWDKKLEDQAKNTGCCGHPENGKNKSCC